MKMLLIQLYKASGIKPQMLCRVSKVKRIKLLLDGMRRMQNTYTHTHTHTQSPLIFALTYNVCQKQE